MSEQWPLVTLGDIALVKGGKRLPKGHTYAETKTQHPYISVKDFTDDGTIDTTNLKYIDGDTFNHISRYTISSNDLYLSIAGTIGKTGIVPEELDGANLTENACKLIFNEGVDRNFVYYFTKSESFIEQAGLFTKATGQPKLALTRLKKILMPLPSLEEQHRIVSILDQVYRDIGFRIGKNNEKLENAREMSQNILNSAFENNDWNFAILEEILSVQPRNGWSPPAVFHSDSGTPVLTLSSVTGNVFKADQYKFTSAPVDPQRHYWVENGDLLITRSNTPKLVGHVAIASGINIPTIYSDLIMRMKPDSEKVLTKFLYYQMQSKLLREEIMGRAKGANPTMVKINKKSLQSIPIYFPSLEKQEIIINFIEQLFQHIRELEAVFHEEASALSEFKQSILQEAFNGNL
jgi:type I restriction enzyme, S subunit